MADSDRKTEEPKSAPEKVRCPRCGGLPAPRRTPSRSNPFLPKAKHLTCIDCGLDYGEDGKAVRP